MRFAGYAQNGRARHWAFDAALGALAALTAMTVAQAARPDVAEPASFAALRGPAPAPAPPPPVFIAFREPAPGHAVTSPFGLRKLPWENHGRLHEGVDISAPEGVAVRAAADGVVTRAGYSPSYGRFVEVKHAAGLTTLYAHMGAIAEAAVSGAALKAGTPIGRIGDTGTSTGPHLHFEIRDADDRPLNPIHFLGHAFASADELPLDQAARVPRAVRIAYVSRIPESKRELMEARRKPQAEAEPATGGEAAKPRPTGRLTFAQRKEAIAKINAQDAAASPSDAKAPARLNLAADPISIPSLDGGA